MFYKTKEQEDKVECWRLSVCAGTQAGEKITESWCTYINLAFALAQILKEIDILLRMQHPNIVEFRAVCSHLTFIPLHIYILLNQ